MTLSHSSSIPDRGIDAHNRPGVPMEREPRPAGAAHWRVPPRQTADVAVLKRVGLDELTPVFGTAQPPHGLSGVVRRIAYRVPEHRARHWALLLMADRIDVIESRWGKALWVLPIAAILGGFAWRGRTRRRHHFAW
jgi:hypothetical protein